FSGSGVIEAHGGTSTGTSSFGGLGRIAISGFTNNTFAGTFGGRLFTWTGAASSDWFDPQNWDLHEAPSAVDTVSINGIVNVGSATQIANVTLLGGQLTGTLTVTNAMTWTAGTLGPELLL